MSERAGRRGLCAEGEPFPQPFPVFTPTPFFVSALTPFTSSFVSVCVRCYCESRVHGRAGVRPARTRVICSFLSSVVLKNPLTLTLPHKFLAVGPLFSLSLSFPSTPQHAQPPAHLCPPGFDQPPPAWVRGVQVKIGTEGKARRIERRAPRTLALSPTSTRGRARAPSHPLSRLPFPSRTGRSTP